MVTPENPADLTPEQCRAARALLDWSQEDLAKRAGITRKPLADFEGGNSTPYPRTRAQLRAVMEAEGVAFIPDGSTSKSGGPGARLKSDVVRLGEPRVGSRTAVGEVAVDATFRGKSIVVEISREAINDATGEAGGSAKALLERFSRLAPWARLRVEERYADWSSSGARRLILTADELPRL